MIAAKVPLVGCPSCAFENQRDAPGCFLCGQSLVGAEPVAARERPGGPVSPSAHRSPSRSPAANGPPFHLTSGMLVIALIAVFLGLAYEAPGLAVAFAIPALLALFRTIALPGDRASWFDDLPVVVTTFVALVAVLIAAVVAFFVTCLVVTGGRSHFDG